MNLQTTFRSAVLAMLAMSSGMSVVLTGCGVGPDGAPIDETAAASQSLVSGCYTDVVPQTYMVTNKVTAQEGAAGTSVLLAARCPNADGTYAVYSGARASQNVAAADLDLQSSGPLPDPSTTTHGC